MVKKNTTGFTLVELMVSVGIATLLMLVVLVGYRSFLDSLALHSAAQDVALAIRKTQTYGLSVKEVASGGGEFNSAYGFYTKYVAYFTFTDNNANDLFDDSAIPTERLEQVRFKDGVVVSEVCGVTCYPVTSSSDNSLQVMFLRPNPDARIRVVDDSNIVVEEPSSGRIVLSLPQGKTVTISVESTGQISIQ